MQIITNEEVIRVNQDPLGIQGHRRTHSWGHEVWAGPLANGSVAVVLLNRHILFSGSITAHWEDIGLSANQVCFNNNCVIGDLDVELTKQAIDQRRV